MSDLPTELVPLSAQQRDIVDLTRAFAREEIRPRARAVDEADVETPWDLWRKAAEVGITGFMLPEEYGGGGFTDVFTQCLVQEELCVGDLGIGNLLCSNGFFADPVLELGSEEQKREWLTPLTGPDTPMTALATTEPAAGSDAVSITTTARRGAGGYLLSGQKAWVAVGTELAESDFWSSPPRLDGTLIRADIDPDQMYAGAPTDVALVGHARAVLEALLAELPDHARVPDDIAALRAARDAETAERDARWIPYLRVLREVLADDAILTSDSAQCCYYGALPHLPIGSRSQYLHPTGFGTLGYALPAAIGAKAARPDRQVVALSGDGGLQFTVQELATAVGLRLPLPVVVFDNGGYGEIRDEMRARGDTPTAVDLPPVDLPALARAYGGHGTRACGPEELRRALTEALATPGPTLIVVPEETR